MAVMSADLHQAVVSTWNTSGLNAVFKTYWETTRTTDYTVLNDQAAGPAQPFPYCIFEADQGSTITRMSGRDNPSQRFEIRDVPFEFRIHTRSMKSGLTAKKIAALLMEEIIKVYGGHPTVVPAPLVLDNGAVLRSIYQSDNSVRDDDQNYSWHIRYIFTLDVPVAA